MRTPRSVTLAAGLVAVLLAGCTEAAEDDTADLDAPDAAEPDGPSEIDAADVEEADGRSVPAMLDGPDGIDYWDETRVDVADGTLTIDAKVADTLERRQQGLMRVPEVPDGAGMLFLFEDLRSGGFWMKDTLVPLDIAYVAENEIVAILQMDPCEADPCPTFDPEVRYDAALEVAQGTFARAGVTEGDPVTWTEPVAVE